MTQSADRKKGGSQMFPNIFICLRFLWKKKNDRQVIWDILVKLFFKNHSIFFKHRRDITLFKESGNVFFNKFTKNTLLVFGSKRQVRFWMPIQGYPESETEVSWVETSLIQSATSVMVRDLNESLFRSIACLIIFTLASYFNLYFHQLGYQMALVLYSLCKNYP